MKPGGMAGAMPFLFLAEKVPDFFLLDFPLGMGIIIMGGPWGPIGGPLPPPPRRLLADCFLPPMAEEARGGGGPLMTDPPPLGT